MKLNSFPAHVPLKNRLSFCAFRAKRLLNGECMEGQQKEFDKLALVPMDKAPREPQRDGFAQNRYY